MMKMKSFSKLFPSLLAAWLALGLAGGASFITPAALAAPDAAPSLSIPLNIPAEPDSLVTVPVHFDPDVNSIASVVFAIDYDQTWLEFDPAVPNAITLNLTGGFVGSCTPDTADTAGEIKCVVYYPIAPTQPLTERDLVTVRLRTRSPVADTAAVVGFSENSPPASFGGTDGFSVPGETFDGSVLISSGCPGCITNYVYLPVVYAYRPEDGGVPPPTGCTNILLNGSFEANQSWEFPATVYPASYSTFRAHNDLRSVRTGIDPFLTPIFNAYSYSSTRQQVYIPSDATSITLKYWEFSISTDTYTASELAQSQDKLEIGKPLEQVLGPDDPNDLQYVLLMDTYNNILQWLRSQSNNNQAWVYREIPISTALYRGWNIKIQFGSFNNGWGGLAAMYVDDAALEVCRP
jgi:hypothetical protein